MKLKLTLDETAEEFFEGTRLLGIVAPLRGYQFCWQVNRQLRVDFRINNHIRLELRKKERTYYFTVFEYAEPHKTMMHYLYCNQFDGEFLLPELRHLDFFWLMKGEEHRDETLLKMIGTVKDITSVQMVTELTNTRIRHRENLII